jgi:hypothetical protein
LAAAALLLAPVAVHAEKKAVLLESYVEDRPAVMQRAVVQIAAAPDVLAGDDLRTKLQSFFARPVVRGTAEDLAVLTKRAADGTAAFTSSNFAVAVTELTQAVDGLAAQPAALASDPKLREVRRDALLTLVKAQVKMNNVAGAQSTLRELFRSYPEIQGLSETQYPPRVVALGTAVMKEKAELAGALTLETRPSRRRIFVNEQSAVSPKTFTNLYPGPYRVYIPSSSDPKRGGLRIVDVLPRQMTNIVIDSEIDDQLELESFIGFRFPSRGDKERLEIPFACAIANVVKAQEVILLTQQRSPSGDPELLGAVYDATTGRREWGVILSLSPSPTDQALSRFALSLRTRREIAGVRVAPPSEPTTAATADHSPSSMPPAPTTGPAPVHGSPPRWSTGAKIGIGLTLGLGAALVATGIGLHPVFDCSGAFGVDSRDASLCGPNQAGRWTVSALIIVGAGSIAAGLGALIGQLIPIRPNSHLRVSIDSTASGATVALRGRF